MTVNLLFHARVASRRDQELVHLPSPRKDCVSLHLVFNSPRCVEQVDHGAFRPSSVELLGDQWSLDLRKISFTFDAGRPGCVMLWHRYIFINVIVLKIAWAVHCFREALELVAED